MEGLYLRVNIADGTTSQYTKMLKLIIYFDELEKEKTKERKGKTISIVAEIKEPNSN